MMWPIIVCRLATHRKSPLTQSNTGLQLTLMSAALKKGGPVSMLTMMMAIMTVWKAGPQPLKAVPAMRARPMATPACRIVSSSGKHWLDTRHIYAHVECNRPMATPACRTAARHQRQHSAHPGTTTGHLGWALVDLRLHESRNRFVCAKTPARSIMRAA